MKYLSVISVVSILAVLISGCTSNLEYSGNSENTEYEAETGNAEYYKEGYPLLDRIFNDAVNYYDPSICNHIPLPDVGEDPGTGFVDEMALQYHYAFVNCYTEVAKAHYDATVCKSMIETNPRWFATTTQDEMTDCVVDLVEQIYQEVTDYCSSNPGQIYSILYTNLTESKTRMNFNCSA